MKKSILILIIVCISGFVAAQTTNYEMIFRYNNKDTLLDRAKIFLWDNTGSFPNSLDWKNAPFCLKLTANDKIGLFTKTANSFSAGQDVGLMFIKVANTGFFMNDYYSSNIGMMVNNDETPNVEIITTSQGLMMRASTYIGADTEIKVRYSDIVTMFPNDITVKLLIHK